MNESIIVVLTFFFLLQLKVGASLKERGKLVFLHTRAQVLIFIEMSDTGF